MEEVTSNRLRVLWVADKLGYGDHPHGVGGYFLSVAPVLEKQAEVIPAVLRATDGLTGQFLTHGLTLKQLQHAPYSPLALWTLIRVIRRYRTNVVHAHGYGVSAFARLAGLCTRTPVIIHQHDSVSKARGLFRIIDRFCAGLTTRAIAVSESVKVFCVSERAIPANRVAVIPNGVAPAATPSATKLAAWRKELRLPESARAVGSITRFHPVKGIGFLVNAMAEVIKEVPEAYLVLWGDGPQRSMLEAHVRAVGLTQRVRFAGFVPDASAQLPLLDCFVLPSLSEGQPFVILEALAAGLPIVATNVGGIPELVEDQAEALLVPAQDASALAVALTRVLKDEALARRLSQAARKASVRYSLDQHVARLQQLYAEVIA